MASHELKPWAEVPASEFRDRQDRARQAAQEAGLDGLVVYSRGGGPLDMLADVLYLTNHYSQLPYVADHFNVGTAGSHAAVILPVDGASILVVDIPWWRADAVVAGEVRVSTLVTESVVEALKDAGLYGKRVGLVGVEFMTASAYLGLVALAGATAFDRKDTLVEQLRIRTSASERRLIRRAAAIGSRAVETMTQSAVEGATEADAVGSALEAIAQSGAALYDAACSSGPHAAHYAWERLPSYDASRRLQRGDLFHVDCYGVFGGYQWDLARTRVIGDQPTEAQDTLLSAVVQGVTYLCGEIKPGLTGRNIYERAQMWLDQSSEGRQLQELLPGFQPPVHVGHGIGLSWCAPWMKPDESMELEPGMYLAIEMFFGSQNTGSAIFEENGLVTNEGFEVLSTATKRWGR